MKGRKNIIVAVGAIVLFAAMVGFFITLDVSPQIAYARLFIDVGLLIGLIAVVLAFYREDTLQLEGILHGIKSLAAGKYHTKLSIDEKDPLREVASGLNELALSLEQQHKKQEEIKRNLREELLPNLRQREPSVFEHSFHPELGPVIAAPFSNKSPELISETQPAQALSEHKLNNPMLDSKPPLNKPEQDLGELYQRFIDAQREHNLSQIDYQLFLATIENTRAELSKSYQCQNILFDIVTEQQQVALQPRIIR